MGFFISDCNIGTARQLRKIPYLSYKRNMDFFLKDPDETKPDTDYTTGVSIETFDQLIANKKITERDISVISYLCSFGCLNMKSLTFLTGMKDKIIADILKRLRNYGVLFQYTLLETIDSVPAGNQPTLYLPCLSVLDRYSHDTEPLVLQSRQVIKQEDMLPAFSVSCFLAQASAFAYHYQSRMRYHDDNIDTIVPGILALGNEDDTTFCYLYSVRKTPSWREDLLKNCSLLSYIGEKNHHRTYCIILICESTSHMRSVNEMILSSKELYSRPFLYTNDNILSFEKSVLERVYTCNGQGREWHMKALNLFHTEQ